MPERKATTYEVGDGVAVITLSRPDRLNAWTARMEDEYWAAMDESEANPDVRVVVVTGAGRGFCAGADTTALAGISATGEYGSGGGGAAAPVPTHRFADHLALAKPVIAAVNGPAAGVGFVLMCFADIRFAASGAKLTTSFGRLGLPAEHGVSWVLPRLVGSARAADLLFSSRVVLAEEAEAIGLVNKTLPADDLLRFTLDYAHRMATQISPWSLRAMKRQLYTDLAGDLDSSASTAVSMMNEAFRTHDFKEGVAALTGKRAPVFGPLGGPS